MSSKRRLSATSGQDEEDENTATTPEPGRKRKKLDPAQQMQAVFDFVRKYKKADGSELCESMIRVPKRRTDPGYYEVVDNPIDILKIQQKLKTDEYGEVEELKADFDLMVANTRTYYKRGSPENKDASELEDLVNQAIGAVEAGDDPATVLANRDVQSDDELNEWLEELFGAVMTAVDASDNARVLNLLFQLLPSQRRYPEYYKVIENPFDLKTIATKIRENKYKQIGELEDDLQVMFKNACSFNEPGSQIYKDARTLSKIVKTKRLELEASKIAQQNRGSRSSRRSMKHNFSIQVANLQYEDSESESDSESEMAEEKLDDPLWSLYSRIKNYTTPSGNTLSEPFLSLPSKRELPDYYTTITDPMSLNMIKKKLKAGEYSTLQDLSNDLDKMFENCKIYNRPESRLFKEAIKLQKVMQSTVNELDSGDEEVESRPGTATPVEEVQQVQTPKLKSPREIMKKKLKILYNAILHWTNNENIQPIGVFMEKPNKRDYPDYYEIISEPIDMNMIQEKIKEGLYRGEEELIADMKLMFSNCRQYNEEGSSIYEDANLLERVLLTKAREMGILQGRGKKRKGARLGEQIKLLYDTLKDYRDAKGRQLSLIFLKLPNKHDYPDYYEIIKRPIDLEEISHKIRTGSYDTLEDALADVTLVFDNACKYNEPDSPIFKDALALRRLAHQTVRHLSEEEGGTGPDAKSSVLELLIDMFSKVYSHQDSEERNYVDSLTELDDHDVINGKKVRALSLEIVKRRLDRGLYKRLDLFQQHVFLILERARRLSRTDSQVFEDTVELQKIFIQTRDQMCGNGRILQSRALLYTMDHLNRDVAAIKAGKMASELPEEESNAESIMGAGTGAWSGSIGELQYHVGDFVYVANEETGMEPHIFFVIRLFEKDGAPTIYGNQFFRQSETFHVPTRKFLEKEVMRGDIHLAVPVSQVLGKCYVMSVKDYFKYKPDGYDEKDIYVCEHKYASKNKNWQKIKKFWDAPEHIRIVQRSIPMEPKRVASVFKDRIEKHKDEIEELETLEKTVEEEIPINLKSEEGLDDNLTYWEQYTIPGPITLRKGDHVLVRAENNKNMIAQIDTMWTGQDGMAYFHGPWFVTPPEIQHQPGKTFFKNEAFLSTISDSNPLLAVVGKCAVLEIKDYCTLRPTQVNEADVHLCESIYDEGKRLLRPLTGGLKKYDRTAMVYPDETFMFSKPIIPEKEPTPAPPPRAPTSMMDFDNEDSMDAPPSVGSVDSSASPAPTKKKMPGKKTVTPYILFSADVRRLIMDENPGVSFGQVSKIVGERWKKMTDQEKMIYEEKSKLANEQHAIKFLEEQRILKEKERLAAELAKNPPPVAMSPGPQHPSQAPSPLAQRPRQDSGGANKQEPIFHTVPPRQPRLLHSEAYIRYIEGLNTESQSMCNWDRQLGASKDTVKTDEAKLPASWLQDIGEYPSSVDALWALRDFMLQEALGVVKLI